MNQSIKKQIIALIHREVIQQNGQETSNQKVTDSRLVVMGTPFVVESLTDARVDEKLC